MIARRWVRGIVETVFWAVVMTLVLSWGISHGEQRGRREALRTNPVSEDLESVCAGLWVGEQNKKYHERDKQK